ncbi:translation initiation factor IF-2 [Firmicutes bacterium CAG:882]|nr:translation initiation factor IF-2 [Firmicutes bacterium CAG:882]
MPKKRIYELSKELNLKNSDIVEFLQSKNVDVKSHSSSIDDDAVDMVKKHFGKGTTVQKTEAPKEIKEQPVKAEAAPKQENNTAQPAKSEQPKQPEQKKPHITAVFNPHNSERRDIRDNRDSRRQDNNGFRRDGNGSRPDGNNRDNNGFRRDGNGSRPDGNNRDNNGFRRDGNRDNNGFRRDGNGSRPDGNNRDNNGFRRDGNRDNNGFRRDGNGNGNRPNGNRDGFNKDGFNKDGGRNDRGDSRRPGGNGNFRGGSRENFNKDTDAKGGMGDAREVREAKEQRSRERENRLNDRNKYDREERKENTKGLEKTVKNNKPATVKQQEEEDTIKTLILPDVLTIKELAEKMKLQPAAVVKTLFLKGTVVTVNQEIDFATAEEIALEFNCICEHEVKVDVIAELLKEEEEDPATLVPRPPVVCVMGHVDHGKTSLLDAIRSTNVTSREAGGITQHIGAYTVEINGQRITFLDTPGHEAFTAMRMRGAQSTDIAILVVAADDGVMPQTVEAINHAKAANIDIIVAVNKIDKPNANVEKVKQELVEYGLVAEDWGGDTIFVPVSAHTKEGIDNLLEMVLLTAEMRELKANPDRRARGLVIEAQLDKGRGPVATLLVQKGTLHVGDAVAAGSCFGKIRAMIDDKGRKIKEAGPATPVEVLGLNDVPSAGEIFVSPASEKEARAFADTFIREGRVKLLDDTKSKLSLDDLFSQIKAGNVKELGLIIKADVQGSVEAVKQSMLKLSNEEVVIKIVHAGVGAINESDVTLASASNAIIIGFNVRPDNMAREIADREKVDVRLYRVIYQAIEDVEAAMKGMLDPIYEEKVIGHAEVRQTYKASGVGTIAGSYILDGMITKASKVRVTRDGEQIYDGPLASLKRFKDDAKEVKAGYECGIVLEKFNDIKELDQIEAYIMVEVPR